MTTTIELVKGIGRLCERLKLRGGLWMGAIVKQIIRLGYATDIALWPLGHIVCHPSGFLAPIIKEACRRLRAIMLAIER